jgi:hypothetical protein
VCSGKLCEYKHCYFFCVIVRRCACVVCKHCVIVRRCACVVCKHRVIVHRCACVVCKHCVIERRCVCVRAVCKHSAFRNSVQKR